MRNRNFTIRATLAAMACTACVNLSAQQKEYPQPEKMTPGMSEYWTPQPKIVTPGDIKTNSAPSDAIVLFDGKDLSAWESTNGQPAQWTVHDGVFTVNKKTGDIQTKQKFNNYQLHIEWCVPENITGTSQGRGNSGIFMQGMYEVQILDCYNNETYVNGQTGSIYKQTPPLQTPCVNRANGMYTTSSTPPDFQGRQDLPRSSQHHRYPERHRFAEQYDHPRNNRIYRLPESRSPRSRPDYPAKPRRSERTDQLPEYLVERVIRINK